MPRAIILVALIGGGIFVAVSYVTQLVHPGGVFEDSASAASSITLRCFPVPRLLIELPV
ncbi:hypothetical protein PV768_01585 [Pseudarthrobacter sp. CC4]|uniref:hypothetical protein n=1 Tax=Pseudarthrobacter sp. CC4 TaxID=3029190 RepID=UPI003B8D3001